MGRAYFGLLVSFSLYGGSSHAAESDPCKFPDPVGQQFSFRLQRAYSAEHGFIGVFDIENHSAKAVAIPGHDTNGVFTIAQPDVTVEAKDITSSWQPILPLPGSFLPRPDRLAIAPGGKGRVTVHLMSEDTANRGASQFRLLLRLFAPSSCVVSLPFTSLPRRAPVTGFESLPVK